MFSLHLTPSVTKYLWQSMVRTSTHRTCRIVPLQTNVICLYEEDMEEIIKLIISHTKVVHSY